MKRHHPILKGDNYNSIPDGELYSVEQALDSVIPWIKYVEDIKEKKIFVFGVGGGGTIIACALSFESSEIIGVDISKQKVGMAKLRAKAYQVENKVKINFLESTYPLPYNTNYFDIVIIADVIEHIVDSRKKYLAENFRVLKKGGVLLITGTPNLIYPYDFHTTNLFMVPWLPSKLAKKYAIWRKKWQDDKDLDYAGRRGTTYWHLISWLRGYEYDVLNISDGQFVSKYLKMNKRLNTFFRKRLFVFFRLYEWILVRIFNIPATALLPYINHLLIRKK